MGDCGEDFKALSAYRKEKKKDRHEDNKSHMIKCGLCYQVDASGSMHFETDKGKVIFYPTTNKYQHKGSVRYGSAKAAEKYIRSLFT